MRKILIIISLLTLLCSCSQKKDDLSMFSATFGNALHGGITLDYDSSNQLLILKRIGSKKISIPPPPPPSEIGYSKYQKDSIDKATQQYYLDYLQPKTSAYKLTEEEAIL